MFEYIQCATELYAQIHSEPILSCLCRCSEDAVLALACARYSQPRAPPPSSGLSQPDSEAEAASMPNVRQALERALWLSNLVFWKRNLPPRDAMDRQCLSRRNQLALQLFLRLHILVATKGTQCQNSCLCLLPLAWLHCSKIMLHSCVSKSAFA